MKHGDLTLAIRAAAILLLTLSALPAAAQRGVVPPGPAVPEGPALTLPVDRKAGQVLELSQLLIEEKNWNQAVRALQALLDAREDTFAKITIETPDGKKATRLVSAHAEAGRIVGTMPEAGRAEYQKVAGEDAATRLAQAKQLGDPALLADVVRRYFYTSSGPEAATLLATHYLNHDEPSLASHYFHRLFDRVPAEQAAPAMLFRAAVAFRRAGDKEQSEAMWKLIAKKLEKDGGLVIGKELLPLKKMREELDRAIPAKPLDAGQWPNFRGGATRTEQGNGSAPFLEATWTQTTLCDTKADIKRWAEDHINTSLRWLDQRGLPVLPALFPIAVGGKVVFRSYDGIYALDLLKEGKLEWYSDADGGLRTILSEPGKKAYLEQWSQFYKQNGPHGLLFENSVIGTLSSDGIRVFAVDDLALVPHPGLVRNFQFGGVQPNFGAMTEQVNRNSLKAYNLESGKLVWELGGKFDRDNPGRGEKASDLADSIILGPPLPVDGKLYVLAERNQELRLVCLEPVDKPNQPLRPKVLWSQTLALSKDKIGFDLPRRIHAAHLAYGSGVLVCPTNAGMVMGVDALSHKLLWAHSYAEAPPVNPAPPQMNQFPMMQAQLNLSTRWRVSAPAISNGKVVFTAPDADHIGCLDLRDGSLLWKVPRAVDELYFAGIIADKVLIVGKSGVRALELANGKPAWRIENVGMPSGQGVASEGVYYLPLKSGPDKEPEVCAINVAQGKIVARTKSRNKDVPGNLIFAGDQVISQTVTAISGYPTVKAKLNQIDQRLKQNPNDPIGLVERADLRLDSGDLAGALADLKTALKNKPAADLRLKANEKLYQTLTEMLQRDFTSAEKHLDEYKALCQTENPVERKRREQTFFLLLGKGRETQGRLSDALAAYLDFASSGGGELIRVIDQPETKARPDVWTRGRINAMLAKATPEQRKPLEEKIAERYKTSIGKNDIDSLRGFTTLFDNTSTVGRAARLQLAQKLMAQAKTERADELREAHLQLLQLRADKEADPSAAGQAVELLAKLMLQKGLTADAAHYYKELGRDYARVIIRDNKTGADLFNEIKTDKRFQPFLQGGKPAWEGKFKVSEAQGNFQMQPSFTLEPVGERTPLVQNLRVAVDLNTQRLRVVEKATGADRWKSPALTSLLYLQHGLPNIRTTYAVEGTVMTLSLGHMVYGFDLADGKRLWEYNLYEPGTNQVPVLGQVIRDAEGNLRLLYQDGWAIRMGQSGPMSTREVIVQTKTALTALDPLTGAVLWTRGDVNNRAQIFGDSQYIFLAEPRGDDSIGPSVRAIRAADGGSFTVPDFSQAYRDRLKLVGRSILVRESAEKGVRLRLYDPLAGKDTWQKDFPAGSLVLKTDDDLAAVAEPDGRLTIVDLQKQKELVKTTIKKELLEKVNDGHLLADRDQFYLVLNRPAEVNINGPWSNMFHGMRCVPVNGSVVALSREGKTNWFNEVEHQMLALEQFADLPILLLTARYSEMANNRLQQVIKVQTISKTSGKLLFDKQLPANTNQFHGLIADPQSGIIDLLSFNMKIRHQLEK